MERAPVDSRAGNSFSRATRSSPFFSSLERIPYSAVNPRRSSSRTRPTTLYCGYVITFGLEFEVSIVLACTCTFLSTFHLG